MILSMEQINKPVLNVPIGPLLVYCLFTVYYFFVVLSLLSDPDASYFITLRYIATLSGGNNFAKLVSLPLKSISFSFLD